MTGDINLAEAKETFDLKRQHDHSTTPAKKPASASI